MTASGLRFGDPETLLTTRAREFLTASGSADVVDLIGYVCNIPGPPRIVAEHLAHAMFAGRADIALGLDGKWKIVEIAPVTNDLEYRSSGRKQPVSGRGDFLRDMTYAVIDTETTGTTPRFGDRITEIAIVLVRNGKIVEVFESLVNPQRPIPAYITQLTHITWDMVKDAPLFEDLIPQLEPLLEGNIFVAHNVGFDWRFVSNEIARATGRLIRGRRLCTVRMAKKLIPGIPRRNLDFVAGYLGIEINNRHRAAGDAVATAHCFNRMLDRAVSNGCETWEDLETLLARRKKRKQRRAPGLPTSVENDAVA